MTDHTEADEIARIFREEAAPVIAEHFHADTCEILRGSTRVPDGRGGYTQVPNVIATVRCRLDATQRVGTEGTSGSRVLSVSSYSVELPYDTDVRPTDELRINGRKFAVTDAKRGGEQDLFLVVGVEERR